jgi:Outer membrane protein beta-barrel domain
MQFSHGEYNHLVGGFPPNPKGDDMRLKLQLTLISAAFFLAASIPLSSQTVPDAEEGHLPFAVGAGYSNFGPDWGPNGRISGGTLWFDYHPGFVPRILDGIGVEAEARDLSQGHPADPPIDLRFDTAGGGVIYTWRHFNRWRPYAKYLYEFGSIDFNVNSPTYKHDTRTVSAPGAGVEVHLLRGFRVRADYEYQFWPDMFGSDALNPNGVTIGLMFDFRGLHHSRLY